MFVRIARLVPATGIVFAALVLVAFVLESGSPRMHASNATWVAYYADAGNRHKEEIAFVLIGLAGLCFLQFLGSLRGALARAEGPPARITTAAIGSGVAFIAIAMTAHVVDTALSWTATVYGPDFTVDPNTARLLASLGYGLFAMSMFAAAAMVLATTTVSFSTGAFPTWLSWFGVLATIGGLLALLGYSAVLVLAWIVLVSVHVLLPERASQPG